MLNKLMDKKTHIKLTFICRNPREYSDIYNKRDPHLYRHCYNAFNVKQGRR